MKDFKNLSEKEKEDFLRRVKEHEEKKKEEENRNRALLSLENRNYYSNSAEEKLLENRERMLSSFQFSDQDKKVVDIFLQMETDSPDYLALFYVLTSFDHHFFVEKRMSYDMSIEAKFFYIFGASLSEAEEASKKSFLFQTASKIYEWMQKSGAGDYSQIQYLNHYLALIGVLIAAIPYEKILLENNFTIGFNPGKTGNRFCVIIPPEKQETGYFKELYDFYYKNISRDFFRNIPSNLQFKDLDKGDIRPGSKIRGFSKALEQESKDILSNKLASLKRKK
jgi:hypothetical protein